MEIEVPMGELVVSKEEGNLYSRAVGSCLMITLYEPKLKIGGMIHAMLPLSVTHDPSASLRQPDAKYVDTAVDSALEKIQALGADRKDLEAKLVGGANMFGLSNSDIGKENVLSAKKKLKHEGIKLIGESIGGSVGRSVEFSVATGIVTVKISF
ncbi:MAG: chemotaxis protein CheD [Candidatus Omnitrophota bacterium]